MSTQETAATDRPESWVPTYGEFGARLALVRWQMKWNLKEAATRCGFSEGNWREWETRGRLPRDFIKVAQQISDNTDVDLYWLMTGNETPNGPVSPRAGASRLSTIVLGAPPLGLEPRTYRLTARPVIRLSSHKRHDGSRMRGEQGRDALVTSIGVRA